ncbi:MAG TPA: ATP-dependent Clp protease ATP-binding subunit ClpX [Alphaproteobacteria bacterium]|nr:ATP-dependent Clp protease ATP-binding subunit ClpX [Alphaproteobacteria bacterium]
MRSRGIRHSKRRCSFCSAPTSESTLLISGGRAFICRECAKRCAAQISREVPPTPNWRCWTPRRLKSVLDEHVIGQEQAKRILSVAVYNHYKRIAQSKGEGDVELAKSNVLLIGPSGSGKTLLAETLARVLDVPFAITDATCLTQTGHVGQDPETILQRLVRIAGGDVAKAEQGIVYIDEIDKIARRQTPNTARRDIAGEGVQQALLPIMDGAFVSLTLGDRWEDRFRDGFPFSTRDILFICGGTFNGLEECIRRREHRVAIGYGAAGPHSGEAHDDLRRVRPDDLVAYGFIPEFIGRLPVIATLEAIDAQNLVRVLTEPRNALIKQYRRLFELADAELLFEESALVAIAQKALRRRTGARALRAILEETLLDSMFEIGSEAGRRTIVVSDALVARTREKQSPPAREHHLRRRA